MREKEKEKQRKRMQCTVESKRLDDGAVCFIENIVKKKEEREVEASVTRAVSSKQLAQE